MVAAFLCAIGECRTERGHIIWKNGRVNMQVWLDARSSERTCTAVTENSDQLVFGGPGERLVHREIFFVGVKLRGQDGPWTIAEVECSD